MGRRWIGFIQRWLYASFAFILYILFAAVDAFSIECWMRRYAFAIARWRPLANKSMCKSNASGIELILFTNYNCVIVFRCRWHGYVADGGKHLMLHNTDLPGTWVMICEKLTCMKVFKYALAMGIRTSYVIAVCSNGMGINTFAIYFNCMPWLAASLRAFFAQRKLVSLFST